MTSGKSDRNPMIVQVAPVTDGFVVRLFGPLGEDNKRPPVPFQGHGTGDARYDGCAWFETEGAAFQYALGMQSGMQAAGRACMFDDKIDGAARYKVEESRSVDDVDNSGEVTYFVLDTDPIVDDAVDPYFDNREDAEAHAAKLNGGVV